MNIGKNEQAKPLVSVAVITYNQADYIRDCLNGLINQTCDFDYEIVVGDDCSTDGTREVVRQYLAAYPLMFKGLLHESNLGAVPSLLTVLRACQGEFITVCEGDDYWIDPSKLHRQVSALQANEDSDLAFHPAIGRCSDYKVGDKIIGYHGRHVRHITSDEIVVGRGGIMPSASIMFRRTVIDAIPEWFSEMAGCDYHLKCLAGARGGALYLPYLMSVYRINSKGSWTGRFVNDGQFALRSFEQAWERSYDLQDLLNLNSRRSFDKLRNSYLYQVAATDIIPLSTRLGFIAKRRKDVRAFVAALACFMAITIIGRLIEKVIRRTLQWRQFALKVKYKLSIC